jgi:dTDP-glucose pyrophosphorylase
MIYVVPMAGSGKRFVDAGYRVPKMLLEAHDKTLLQWSVDSLPLDLAHRLVFVGLKEHEAKFGLRSRICALYEKQCDLAFVDLDAVTGGQAETVLAAENWIEPDLALVIFNIDTMFRSSTLRQQLGRQDVDGVLGSFRSVEARFSFAKLDSEGFVTRVVEKEPISDSALTGLYHFRRASDFLEAARSAVRNDRRVKGEFYVAPLYNEMLSRGARLVLDHVSEHHILGTPEEYAAFRAAMVGTDAMSGTGGKASGRST